MNDDSYQLYSHKGYTKYPFYLFSIALALLILFLIGQMLIQIGAWVSEGIDSSKILGFIILLLVLGFAFAFCLNAYPDVRVYDEGLKIQVFVFWWFFVPWTDIQGIWTVGVFKKSYAVAVGRLTPFHRIIGLGYGSLRPVVAITWTMSKHKELVKTILQNSQIRR